MIGEKEERKNYLNMILNKFCKKETKEIFLLIVRDRVALLVFLAFP